MLWLVRTTPGAYDTTRRRSRASGLLWGYGALMLRPRARVGRAPTVLRLRGLLPRLVPGLVIGVLLVVAGCGSDDSEAKADEPSKAALECREQWKDLEADVEGRETQTYPSALAPRWNGIVAAVDYYAAGATADDCGKTIEDAEEGHRRADGLRGQAAPFDMERRLAAVKEDAEAYADGSPPPAPKPSPAKKGKKAKKPPRPPKPADIEAALATLTKQAPLATEQQEPAWQQATGRGPRRHGRGEEGAQGHGLHLQGEQGLPHGLSSAGGDPPGPEGIRGLTAQDAVRRR